MAGTPTDELIDMLRGMDDEGQRMVGAFMRALDEFTAIEPARNLPGLPDVHRADLNEALARNEARLWAEREQLYRSALTRQQAAERLGVGTNQVSNLLRDGDLLAIDGDKGLRLPAWQFHPEARRGRLDGIREVAAVFPGGLMGLSSWVEASNPVVNGRSPRQALAEGDLALVVSAADAIGT